MIDLKRLSLLLALSVGSAVGWNDHEPFVVLTSDSPAVLDAPLTVTATLKNVRSTDGPFVFSFSDDASPLHWKEKKTDDLSMNFTVTYSSGEYVSRHYVVTCRVYVDHYIYRDEIAKRSIRITIKKNLSGHISVVQNNVTLAKSDNTATLQTKVMSKFQVHLYDPEDFFRDSDVLYFWFINDTSYGNTRSASFLYNFTSPGPSSIEVFVVARKRHNGTNHPNGTHRDWGPWWDAESREPTSLLVRHAEKAVTSNRAELGNVVVPKDIKTGMFRMGVSARNPITKVTVSGDTSMKHGLLLNLTVNCDGTGPFETCWTIKGPNYNSTGNETCTQGTETWNVCQFPIQWYFRRPGQSAIIIIVDNVLNHEVKQVGINVYDVPSRTPVSLIVIPMCSGLIAVVACITGVFAFMTFKRNMTGLETADFDFSCPDEQLEYKTFWERLRDSMVNALSNSHNDGESHVSSVSSRSVQGPPVGIHYGSIS